MAHEVETMFVARELAWHGLGTFVPEAVGSTEALALSGLDWEVRLEDAYTGDGAKIPETKVTRRSTDNRVLGVVGERYTPIQNHELFTFTDDLAEYGAKYESAGSLAYGKYVFTTMVIERPMTLVDDPHIPYIVMASSHDGSMATRALLSPVRVVCMNTLRLAIRNARRSFVIRHTASAPQRIEQARRALGIAFDYYDGFEDEVRALMAQSVTEKEFEALIENVWPEKEALLSGSHSERKRHEVKALYQHDDALTLWKGTGWGALNAFNTWELWNSPVRVTKNVDEQTVRSERQAMSVLRDGTGLTEQVHKMLVKVRD